MDLYQISWLCTKFFRKSIILKQKQRVSFHVDSNETENVTNFDAENSLIRSTDAISIISIRRINCLKKETLAIISSL
jgi:hypothetical protein